MAHPDYIAAAKAGNRSPTVYVKIESADGETLYYTTQGDWQGSDTLTNIDTTFEPGSITQELFAVTPTLDTQVISDSYSNFNYLTTFDSALRNITGSFVWPVSAGITVRGRIKITDSLSTPTFTVYTPEENVAFGGGVGELPFNRSIETTFTSTTTPQVISGTTFYATFEFFQGGAWQAGLIYDIPSRSFDLIKPTSQAITSAIDFGSILTTNPVFSTDDVSETGSVIAYSYTYSDDDITYTSGGSITDGDSLVASRYYKIQADITTTTSGRVTIREYQLSEGVFVYLGTHIDEPFSGVSPQLVKNSISSFSQKISIGKGLSTTGQSTIKMFWVAETSDLIASGYLRGQDVSIYSGFVGLSTEAYEPVMVGTWYDHSLDEVQGEISVKIQDAFKQFEKHKIPLEVINNSTGAITTTPIEYDVESLVDVMVDVFDQQVGLRDRYISPDFATLGAGDYAAAKYKVSRTITKPTEANKLLDELAQTGSMFLIPLGNGQIKPKPFDINQEHTETLDADFIDFVNLEGNLDKFFSRFYSYYNPKTSLTEDPSDDRDDYDNGVALLDTNAELRWFPEKGVKQFFDKWKVGRIAPATALTAPPQALIDKNALDNALLTEPLYTVSAKKLGPRFANIEPADVVAVDNLKLPVVNNAWVDSASYSGKTYDAGSDIDSSFFNNDGTKFYTVKGSGATPRVSQHNLTIAFDISTAYSVSFLDISTETTSPRGGYLTGDGTKLFIVDSFSSNKKIFRYTLSTPYVISSGSYDSMSFDLSSEGSTPFALTFNPDGQTFYIGAFTASEINQYNLNSAWDLTTASYSSITLDTSSQDLAPYGISISSDGKIILVNGASSSTVYRYDLGAAWNVSTAVYSGQNYLYSSQLTGARGFSIDNTGNTMYLSSSSGQTAYQYNIPTSFAISAVDYIEGDRVIHDGKMWRARQDSTGKDPTSEAAFWQDTEITSEGFTNGKHFFVLGRKFNPNTALIDLDLMEMPPGTLGSYNNDYSDDYDI